MHIIVPIMTIQYHMNIQLLQRFQCKKDGKMNALVKENNAAWVFCSSLQKLKMMEYRPTAWEEMSIFAFKRGRRVLPRQEINNINYIAKICPLPSSFIYASYSSSAHCYTLHWSDQWQARIHMWTTGKKQSFSYFLHEDKNNRWTCAKKNVILLSSTFFLLNIMRMTIIV